MNDCLQEDMKHFIMIKQDVEKNESIWWYLDPKLKKQGPFKTDQIFSWRKMNYFQDTLPISFKDKTY